jgi:flagellum-specific peptidoglycan hydrolase FlgJ
MKKCKKEKEKEEDTEDAFHPQDPTQETEPKDQEKSVQEQEQHIVKAIKSSSLDDPQSVLAQAVLETNEFKSNIFKENNNLFGMKEATKRPTTNSGVENGHAYYNSWRESVQDYAMFAAAYLNDIKTEEEYFQYLRANYAEDSMYVEKLKKIIKEFNTINLVNSK